MSHVARSYETERERGGRLGPPRVVTPQVGAVAQIGSSGPRKASVPVARVTLKPPVEFR